MSQPTNSSVGPVLTKALFESSSDKDHATFNRVEAKYTEFQKAKIRSKLEDYRRQGKEQSTLFLSMEKHKSSSLGAFLRSVGSPRPGPKWEAHHIVSGGHAEAASARAVLAQADIKIRIDDPINGCWMPKTKADARPTMYPNAIPHCRIHRERYYDWIFNMIMNVESDGEVEAIFNTVRKQLLHGHIKNELLLSEIDDAEYTDWNKKL